jgi:hypothetical protein
MDVESQAVLALACSSLEPQQQVFAAWPALSSTDQQAND